MKRFLETLKECYESKGRPLNIACDWDDVIYMTEQECLVRLLKVVDSIPEDIKKACQLSEEKKDITIYPHAQLWDFSITMKIREITNKIFWQEDLFKQDRVLDTIDGLLEGLEKGWIERLVFMTYSAIKKNRETDIRKKAIFSKYFEKWISKNKASMILIPFNMKGTPYEKGKFLGEIFPESDILIDNHLTFIKWSITYSKTNLFLVPHFNQKINDHLKFLVKGSCSEIKFFEPAKSKNFRKFEY